MSWQECLLLAGDRLVGGYSAAAAAAAAGLLSVKSSELSTVEEFVAEATWNGLTISEDRNYPGHLGAVNRTHPAERRYR